MKEKLNKENNHDTESEEKDNDDSESEMKYRNDKEDDKEHDKKGGGGSSIQHSEISCSWNISNLCLSQAILIIYFFN